MGSNVGNGWVSTLEVAVQEVETLMKRGVKLAKDEEDRIGSLEVPYESPCIGGGSAINPGADTGSFQEWNCDYFLDGLLA